MAKHTPGPWEYDGHSRIDAVALRKPTGHTIEHADGTKTPYLGGLVALPYGASPDDDLTDTHLGNALLIAAAPDLLEAAECAANVLFLLHDELAALGNRAGNVTALLHAAIKKAKGPR